MSLRPKHGCYLARDLYDIVRQVRFAGWQRTTTGVVSEVQKTLRRSLVNDKFRTDQDLFDCAYGYLFQYY